MPEGGGSLPEVASKELSRKLLEGEAKLEQGSFEEAEVTLREALSINNEVHTLYKMHSDFLASRIFGNATTVLGGILSINPNSHAGALQEARALLGRIEYRKGNFQGALRVLEGIRLSGLAQSMRFFATEKTTWSHRKGKNQKPATLNNFLHASSLLIEAIYLKAKSHEKLGALEGATRRLPIDLVLCLSLWNVGLQKRAK